MTRLVLFGGGHAHAWVLRRLRSYILKNLDVVLVSPEPKHVYSGMVPGVIAGHYAPDAAEIDLAALAREAGAERIPGRVLRLDPDNKCAVLDDGDTVPYDIASLNLGSQPAFSRVHGAAAYAIASKPFGPFIARWRELLARRGALRLAVAGGGASGVEIAMAMKFALDARGKDGSVVLFSERSSFAPEVGARVARAMARLGVEVRKGTTVTAIEAGPRVVSEVGAEDFDAVVWSAGAEADPLLRASGLRTDERGYVLADACLRSVSHPDVFAAGDTATVENAPAPKSGVYAVRHAKVLAENLMRVVRGAPMLDYVHRGANLVLLSCGGKYAIATRGGWSAEGAWAWRWKDWLDRGWIRKFR